MKHRNVMFLLSMLLISTFISCENDDEIGGDETNVMSSSYNETESHNAGKNCMSCHVSGGSGEGRFTVAGTAYNSAETSVYPNATVKLYTGENGTGTLVKTIEVDAKGNFYTTATIDFGSGLYPVVTGTSGNVSTMSSKITTGQCNSCHGSSTGKITAN